MIFLSKFIILCLIQVWFEETIMLKLTKTKKKILKDAIKESVKTGAKVMVTGVALSAAAAMGGPVAGLAAGGTVWAVLTQTKHLSNGFNAGLKKWMQKDNQPLSLRAKLLKFRNAVSVGAATAHNSLENENMKRNPFFKTFYEKAAKEGRKVKFSERLKAALQFSAAKHEVRMIHKKNIDNILASYRQR